jgi:adenylate cyclase
MQTLKSDQDFEDAGLLDDLGPDDSRSDRLALLRWLAEAGVSVEELQQAVAEERLPVLPMEVVLRGKARYTVAELAKQADVPEDFLRRLLLALGLPEPEAGERYATDEDLESAQALVRFGEAGLSEGAQLEVARVLRQAMANIATVIMRVGGEALIRPGDSEHDLGVRYAEMTQHLLPLAGGILTNQLRLHLRERLRREAIGRAERASGQLPEAVETTIAFADLVGFTRRGEELDTVDIGRLARRLAVLTEEVAQPPVRLVKTIGDEVMLASRDTDAVVRAVLGLIAAVEAEGKDFPRLHAGLAHGAVMSRDGDLYGAAVNHASRVTDLAKPGSALTTETVYKHTGSGFAWSRAGRRSLKGVDHKVALYRVRYPEAAEAAQSDADS